MASKKFSLVRGRAMRATRLNGCGNPVNGPRSVVTTDGFISVGLTANSEEGESISVTNAAGRVCVQDTPPPKFSNYSVEVAFCGVDPDLVTMLTGQPVVKDATGDIVGFRQNSKIDVDLTGFALELWSAVPQQACDASGDPSYGYFLLPFIKGGVLGDFTVENAAINFTLTGATTRDGSGWGVGPYDVTRTAGGAAGPLLEPIDDGDHLHLEVTTVAPPTNLDGGAAPLGVLATSANAGTPGTTVPANSYLPETLTELQASGITASPTTAWAANEYVVLGDGITKVQWDGAAWVAV
jgi:hypothetical protein